MERGYPVCSRTELMNSHLVYIDVHVQAVMHKQITMYMCSVHTFVVQLQRNSHAVKSCIISCGQSNTDIRCPILISDRKLLPLLGLAAFHSVASKIYTKFKMHQSSLQPEKNDPSTSSRRRSTTKREANAHAHSAKRD